MDEYKARNKGGAGKKLSSPWSPKQILHDCLMFGGKCTYPPEIKYGKGKSLICRPDANHGAGRFTYITGPLNWGFYVGATIPAPWGVSIWVDDPSLNLYLQRLSQLAMFDYRKGNVRKLSSSTAAFGAPHWGVPLGWSKHSLAVR